MGLINPYEGVESTLGIGTAAGDAIGFGAKAVGKVGMAVGKAGFAIGSAGAAATVWAGGQAGKHLGLPVLKGLGKVALGTPGFLINGAGPLGSPIKGAAKYGSSLAKNMVKYEGSHLKYNKYLGELQREGPSLKMTKFGYGVIGGLAGVQFLRGAYGAYMGSRMGTVDTKTTSLTPDFSPQEYRAQHPDFAGATGDLVFALSANRHG